MNPAESAALAAATAGESAANVYAAARRAVMQSGVTPPMKVMTVAAEAATWAMNMV